MRENFHPVRSGIAWSKQTNPSVIGEDSQVTNDVAHSFRQIILRNVFEVASLAVPKTPKLMALQLNGYRRASH